MTAVNTADLLVKLAKLGERLAEAGQARDSLERLLAKASKDYEGLVGAISTIRQELQGLQRDHGLEK